MKCLSFLHEWQSNISLEQTPTDGALAAVRLFYAGQTDPHDSRWAHIGAAQLSRYMALGKKHLNTIWIAGKLPKQLSDIIQRATVSHCFGD